MDITEIKNQSEFDEFTKAEGLNFVKFSASWCGPCKAMNTMLSGLDSDKVGGAKCAELDVEEDGVVDIVEHYHIQSLPTTLFFKNGEMIHREVGMLPQQKLISVIDGL